MNSNKAWKFPSFRYCFSNWYPVNLKFLKWIDTIETSIFNTYELYLLDIPDENYMYYFENNYSPKEVIKLIQDDFEIFSVI